MKNICKGISLFWEWKRLLPQAWIKNLPYLYIYMWRHIICLTPQIDYAKDYLSQYLYYLSHLIMQVIDYSNCSAGQ